MKLSIIIPCYNCSTTISRLLESILANGLDKNDYEVIIVDDNSTDGFLNVVSEYESKMDIVYAQTVRDVHCPGNTREIGLGYVQGEWFMFADNDDMFEPTAFKTGLDYSVTGRFRLKTVFKGHDFLKKSSQSQPVQQRSG